MVPTRPISVDVEGDILVPTVLSYTTYLFQWKLCSRKYVVV